MANLFSPKPFTCLAAYRKLTCWPTAIEQVARMLIWVAPGGIPTSGILMVVLD